MAKISNNSHLQGVTGKVGKYVVRKLYGESILQVLPDKPKKLTAHQEKSKAAWIEAARYGKLMEKDPVLSIAYAKKIYKGMSSVYTVARTDYLKPPKVVAIYTHNYTGTIGSKIVVEAVDDFKVVSVKVVIKNKYQEVIEEGDATNINGNNMWYYITKVENKDLTRSEIIATAYDTPLHSATMEKVI